MSDFYQYFKENMDSLGLATPESLFSNSQSAVSTASTLLALIDKFGKKVTVAEMIGAGTKIEKLTVLGAINASYYTGAVIGSIAVATGRVLTGGTSLSEVLLSAQMNHLHRPWLSGVMVRHPEIYSQRRSTQSRRSK